MGSERIERRAVPRAIYTTEAIVFFNSNQFTCRAMDISTTGLLLVAPTDIPVGRFVRMNISLPGLDEVMDVDGEITTVRQDRIARRSGSTDSSMPAMAGVLTPRELRDVIAFLASLKTEGKPEGSDR